MFPTHTIDSAPTASKETLANIEKKFGFIPTIAGKLAEAPVALNGYIALTSIFSGSDSTLNAIEQQIVLVSTSERNGCTYCTAVHGMMVNKLGLAKEDVLALQAGKPLADSKLEALRLFTAQVVEKRGWVDTADIDAFLTAGYTHPQVLEVITGVAVKTITNYTNHIAKPELDEQFAGFAVAKQAAE